MPLRKLPGGWRSAVAAAEAVAALAITQATLRFCRFQTVRRVLLAAAKVGRRMHLRPVDTTTLVWAVQRAERRCPIRSTCLGQALVAEALLHQYGYKPVLCIGAARHNGRLQAHAWLEQNDAVVIGGPEAVVEQYTRFPEIDSLAL
jgi:Transglutaminase-like superfamily